MRVTTYLSLQKRRDFVLLNQTGRYVRSVSLTLKALNRTQDVRCTHEPRVGFTVTKRLGDSVVRHRIRRRLKEAVRTSGVASTLRPHTDYVLIAQPGAQNIRFIHLQEEIIHALKRVHRFLEPNHSVRVN